jgi:hypothetical protein
MAGTEGPWEPSKSLEEAMGWLPGSGGPGERGGPHLTAAAVRSPVPAALSEAPVRPRQPRLPAALPRRPAPPHPVGSL